MKALLTLVPASVVMVALLSACTVDPNRRSSRPPTAAEVEAHNASAAPEDQIICRTEKPFGTRISQRICRRAGDIASNSENIQREMNRVNRSSGGNAVDL